jgi:hypothetical protein
MPSAEKPLITNQPNLCTDDKQKVLAPAFTGKSGFVWNRLEN